MSLQIVGKREKRYDGLDHITGKSQFADDIIVPGMLAAKVFRSPVIKGQIKNIDTTAAEKVPGVAAVITAKDVPNNVFGPSDPPDQPVLTQQIRYKGEPMAAVAAVDEDTALEAISRIKVDISEEEGVIDPLEAMKPDAPKVRPEGNLFMFGENPFRELISGDIEAGFKEADEVVEGDYCQPSYEHTPLETQCSLAIPEPNGKLKMFSVSQCPWFHIGELCSVLKMPMSKVRYIGGTVGGGFGSKTDIHADHVAAVLALKTGQPVKWRWTREEELLYSTHRGAWHIKFKDGIKKDGKIVARQAKSIRDSGAYTSLNPYAVEVHCIVANGPYTIPNVHIQGYLAYTNKPMAMAMRGFGINAATYATEVQMNRIAETIGMDPWEIRFINAYRNGDKMPIGKVLDSVALVEVMEATAQKAGITLPAHLKAMTSSERKEA
jgi:CO/xanthine dehydrogenase Mo-binding subunit